MAPGLRAGQAPVLPGTGGWKPATGLPAPQNCLRLLRRSPVGLLRSPPAQPVRLTDRPVDGRRKLVQPGNFV